MAVDRLGRPLRDDPYRGNVRVYAASNITLSGLQTIDGVALESGDRVLCNGQTTTSQNGIYVASNGVWSRSRDLSSSDDFTGPIIVTVEEGTTYRNTFWHMLPSTTITVGTDAISFTTGYPAAQFGNGSALSVFGRASNSSGSRADIAGTDGQVLRVSGTTLGFGTVAAAGLASDSVTTAKILDSNVTTAKIADANVTLAKLGGDITTAGKALLDDANAAAQRTTLGAAASGANTDITALGGLTVPLPINSGGTNSITEAAARTALGVLAKAGDTLTGPIEFATADSEASAGTVALGSTTSNLVEITGTTTITSFGTVAAGVWRLVKFAGALTLTHNATSLILPTGGNITTAAGDTAIFVSEGSGNWRCYAYSKPSGGGTTNFLRADGTWAEPPGGGGVTGLEVHTPVAANTGPVAVTIDTVTAPIRKRLKTRFGINTTTFNGSTWMSRAADLTGIADGKEGLFHIVVDFAGNDATNTTIITNGNGRFKVFKGTDNKIRFLGYNAAGSLILDMRTNTAYTASSGVIVLTASWNLATGATHIYVNGAEDRQAAPTATNDTIDYTATRWDVGADNNTQHLNGDLGIIMFDDGYVDLSSSRELRRFQTGNGLCAYMPAGRVYDSYSTQPLLYLTGNAINIKYNHGSAGNATAFTVPNGTLANGTGINGSIYKDLASGDLQADSPVTLTWDDTEDVWVAPIAIKSTKYAQDYGATGTTETFTVALNTSELVIEACGPGGGGGGGGNGYAGGGGGSGVRAMFRFGWIPELGGVPLSLTLRSTVVGGTGNGAGTGNTGSTGSHTLVDFPDTLGGVQIQFGAGTGGEGGQGGSRVGRGGRAGTTATTTVDQGGSDYWPNGISITQFNRASFHGESGFNTSGGRGGVEGDIGGGGAGGDSGTNNGAVGQGSYMHIEWIVEE